MVSDRGQVVFRPLEECDLPLIARWLAEDHVHEWWRSPSDLDKVRAKYLPRIAGADPTKMFVIVHQGRDIGLIQSYLVRDHPDWAASIATWGLSFPLAAGIDYFIGERSCTGRGIGSLVIRAFTEQVFAAHPSADCVVVTPQMANRASCRILEKAGYQRVWSGMLISDDPSDAGPAALYVRRRADLPTDAHK